MLSLSRKVSVTSGEEKAGFSSAIRLSTESGVSWVDVQYLAPGLLYGDPTYDGDRSPGGTLNYAARRFLMREDMLPAPLFALSFKNGSSVAMLDPAPRGDTTVEETRLSKPVMTDARFQFGALGAWQAEDGAIEFGFSFPGTVSRYAGGPGEQAKPRMDPALSSDRPGRGPQLPSELSLRAERVVSAT